MVVEVVGRVEELRELHRFLDRPPDGPTALVLEGEAGIGKSTLWLAGVHAARERGLRVLASRPAEAELRMAFAGLGDLLDGALEDVLPVLATPRRRALETALLLGDADDSFAPRALGVAVRDALATLAREQPLVVAIDDVQWLDRSSSGALAFALRRLDAPLRLLLARRLADEVELSEVEGAFPPAAVARLVVGPLSVGAIQSLVRERFARTFARPTLVRIHETSGGNAFYALEIARALGSEVDPTQPLPVPPTLEGLVVARLAGLPEATREALAFVAAAGNPTAELLARAGLDLDVLDPAFASHVLEAASGATRFTHPLLATVVYRGAAESERRRIHRLLAGAASDFLEQARHLAQATNEPASEVASLVDEASEAAEARGATAEAVALRDHALRLTPADAGADRQRRMLAAARAHLAVASIGRARALVTDALERSPAGGARAEALLLLARGFEPDVATRIALMREALVEVSELPALQARIHRTLGWELRFLEGNEVAVQHAEAALEIARQLDDEAGLAAALATLSAARLHAGIPGAVEVAEEAARLTTGGDPALRQEIVLSVSSTFLWTGHHERARELLEPFLAEWRDRDEQAAAQALWRLIFVGLFSGHFDVAAVRARAAHELHSAYGDESANAASMLWALALVAAHRGRLEEARSVAERGLELSRRRDVWFTKHCETTLGLVALWGGDAVEAVERFVAAEEANARVGTREPALATWVPGLVEAQLELGRIPEAATAVAAWESEGVRLGRATVLAEAARCRGLVAAARGQTDDAIGLLERAVTDHARLGNPFGRARALLSLGTIRRRARQKRAAREAIAEALAVFEKCGAAGWAETARSELGRIGGRTREEGLTQAERRVASLVVEGRTNREVAAALFLGERTVETHLTHIYAKLGVRSRTELARVYEPAP